MEAARAIRAKYADQVPEVEADLRINQIVTDVPFEHAGGDVVESHFDSTSGTVMMELGLLDDPDVTVTTDYDTAKAIFVEQDPAMVMQSFMNGLIKVQGDLMKLMAMQTSLPSNEFTEKISEEIREITE